MSKTLILKPRISEKAYGSSQQKNVYVFEVPGNANKHTVADAVAEQFSVTVETVNIANIKGKAKQSYRKRSRAIDVSRSDVKKAYVKLKEGDTIPVFAAMNDSNGAAEVPKETK